MVRRMNILLIALDTLRADHLSCYGYEKKTSPNIDEELAGEGVLFYNFIAPGIPTHPGYTTIFTGMHPLKHKIVCHAGRIVLDRSIPTLPEILYRNGYVTAAVDNLIDTGGLWFSRGYEYYLYPGGSTVISRGAKISGEKVTEKAVKFLRWWGEGEIDSKPFFLFIHYWDPHAPYLPPAGYRERFYSGGRTDLKPLLEKSRWGRLLLKGWVGRLIDEGYRSKEYFDSLYDEEILYTDHQVSRVLEVLEEIGEIDNTLVIVTADHGEGLGENGIFYDHHGLYDWDIRVPFIMRLPKTLPRGKRIDCLATHEDILPTVLDILGINAPPNIDGISLLPIIDGSEGRRRFVVSVENTRMAKRSIRTLRWKLIETLKPDIYGNHPGHLELYDLESPEGEEENLASSDTDLKDELLSIMEVWYRRKIGGGDDPLASQPISLPIP